MKKILSLCLAIIMLSFCFVGCADNNKDDRPDYALIKVKNYGEIVVKLCPDVAPITVKNFKDLVSNGFYDGLIFHRIIEDFMIQGGGYTTDWNPKNADTIKGEFSANGFENNLKHDRGVISMARTDDPDSASSQFFIVHKDSPHLDGKYAAFGYVVSGIEVVDAIASVVTYNDMPLVNIEIESITLIEYTEK